MSGNAFLGPDDPLPLRPHRVLVNGVSGSGKTTLAAELGRRLDLPHVEIDALHWGPGWTSRPEFAADVAALAAQDRWVTEYQYSQVRGMLADRADLVVWLDLPRLLVLARVVRRTLVRRLARTPLWGGLVEPPLWTFLTERDHIVRWSWRTYPRATDRVMDLCTSHPQLVCVRLRSRAEVRRWLVGRTRQTEGPAPSERTTVSEPAHLNDHHRDTVAKIMGHPVSHNVEWRSVVSLLDDTGTTEQQHDGQLKATVAGREIVLHRPHGDDVDEQTVVDLRGLLAAAGYGAVDRTRED